MASLNHFIRLNVTLLFFFFFFFLHSASSTPDKSPNFQPKNRELLISRTCQKADNYEFCMNVLQSHPQITSAPNPSALAKAVLQLAMLDTIIAREQIRVLSRSKDTQPAIKEIQSCVDLYDLAAKQFNVSSQELEDPTTASYDAALAGAQSGYCEEALASARVKIPEISALNKKLLCFFRIAMAVIETLDQGSAAAKSPHI